MKDGWFRVRKIESWFCFLSSYYKLLTYIYQKLEYTSKFMQIANQELNTFPHN